MILRLNSLFTTSFIIQSIDKRGPGSLTWAGQFSWWCCQPRSHFVSRLETHSCRYSVTGSEGGSAVKRKVSGSLHSKSAATTVLERFVGVVGDYHTIYRGVGGLVIQTTVNTYLLNCLNLAKTTSTISSIHGCTSITFSTVPAMYIKKKKV